MLLEFETRLNFGQDIFQAMGPLTGEYDTVHYYVFTLTSQ